MLIKWLGMATHLKTVMLRTPPMNG